MAKKKRLLDDYDLTEEQDKEREEIRRLAMQYLKADPGWDVVQSFLLRCAAFYRQSFRKRHD